MKKTKLLGALVAVAGLVAVASCGETSSTPTSTAPIVESTSPVESTAPVQSTAPVESTTPVESTVPVESTFVEDLSVVHEISTVEQLVAFSQSTELKGKYKLTADIDLSGVTLTAPTLVFSGEFDGDGHVIKNGILDTDSPKVGIVFYQLVGATIKNVKFASCFATGSSESIGVLAGLCEGATFNDIEFSNCGAFTEKQNYCGLLYARNTTAADIVIDGLTVKNSSYTGCAQYGGLVAGDIVSGSTFTIKNAQIAGEFKNSTGNGSAIVGRNRGANVVMENVVVTEITLPSKQTGIWSSGNSTNTVSLKNCVVLSVLGSSQAPMKGKGKETWTFDNVYTVGFDSELSGPTKIESSAVTTDWYFTTLGLSADLWEVEGDTVKLKSASSNVPSADATITNVNVTTGAAKTKFYTGEEFSADGITVIAKYSDGVQVLLKSDAYTIDDSAVDVTKAGTYTVTVTPTNSSVSGTYEVVFRQEDAVVINVDFAKKIYVVGDLYSKTNVYAYSKLSDGTEDLLDEGYSVDSSDFDGSQAGTYTITVTYKSFSASYQVTVVEGILNPIDNQIQVVVDADITSAYELVDGYPTFNTVSGAMDYINASKFSSDVEKIVYIMDGKYEEKVTVAADNVTFIGESKENTIITTKLIEDSPRPEGGTYGLDCASVHVNGKNFKATNMSIRNDFDYVNDASKYGSPQGLALTINGDQAVLFNVILYGNQDTLYLKSGRTYITDSKISGNVDFIFGNYNGIGYFNNCEIQSTIRGVNQSNGGYITAMKAEADTKPDYGYVFYNCKLTAEEGVLEKSVGLGRTWGRQATCAYINCEMGAHIGVAAYGEGGSGNQSRWNQMNNYSPVDADFAEYGTTGAAAITEAVAGGKLLTAEEAANYTVENVLATTNGKVSFTGEFKPTDVVTAVSAYVTKGSLTAPEFYVEEDDEDPTVMSKSTILDFTTADGTAAIKANEKVTIADGTTIRDNGSEAQVKGTISFKVLAGTTITVVPYGNASYVNYTLGVQGATDLVAQNGEYSITVEADCVVEYIGLSNNYVKTISFEVPNYIKKSMSFDFTTADGTAAVKASEYVTVGTSTTIRDNGSEAQVKGSILFAVKSGSVVTVVPYGNASYVNYTLGVQGAADLVAQNGEYSFTATSNCIVEYIGLDNNYVKTISVSVPLVITKTTVLDFTTADGTAAIKANEYVTVGASTTIRDNGSEAQVKGSISFNVKAGTTVTVVPYGNASYVNYTLGVQGATDLVAQNGEYSFTATEDCTVEYIGLDNNYVKTITVSVPKVITKTTVLDFTTADGTAAIKANEYVTVGASTTIRDNGSEAQVKGSISFKVNAGATVTVVPYANASYVNYTLGVEGATDLVAQNGEYSFTATETCTVEYIGLDNNYVKTITISY